MKHRNRLNVVLLLTMLSSTTNLIARRSDNLLPDTAHWEKLIIGAPTAHLEPGSNRSGCVRAHPHGEAFSAVSRSAA